MQSDDANIGSLPAPDPSGYAMASAVLSDLMDPTVALTPLELQAHAITLARASWVIGGERASSPILEELLTTPQRDLTRRALAAAFLRALNYRPTIIGGPDRAALFRLFDSTWPDVYKSLHLRSRSQSHEKEATLLDAKRQLLDDLNLEVGLLATTESIREVQNRILRILNGARAKAFLHPLVHDTVLGTRLLSLFTATTEFVTSAPDVFLDAHDHADEVLQAYLDDAKHFTCLGSHFAGIPRALIQQIGRAFSRSSFAEPAQCSLIILPRKYPLLERDAEIRLAVSITNQGAGPALGLSLDIDQFEGLTLPEPQRYLGDLPPGQLPLELPARTTGLGSGILTGALSWSNTDRTTGRIEFLQELQPQSTTLDWNGLRIQDPYSLEPVVTLTDLAGRSDILDRLIAMTEARQMGNAYITGQKRVGKTSVARVLASRLVEKSHEYFRTLYVEAGDFVSQDPDQTVHNLGRLIVEGLVTIDPRWNALSVPDFSTGLAPLGGLLDAANQLASELRLLIVLDEFDSLPLPLYRRGPAGVFQSLRSISGRPFLSLVLIGGEKIPLIMAAQGESLNRFQRFDITFFPKATLFTDFADLIRQPTQDLIDFDDDLVSEIFELSAGSPYFAKLICGDVLARAIKFRTEQVGPLDLAFSRSDLLARLDQTHFAHFWDDGVLDEPAVRDETSMRRRTILLALGEHANKNGWFDASALIERASRGPWSRHELEAELADLDRRGVVVRGGKGEVACRPPLLGEWLREYGRSEMFLGPSDPEAWEKVQRALEDSRISAAEIQRVAEGIGSYRGRPVGVDDIRNWIEQFGGPLEQRLAFVVLEHMKFYSQADVRARFETAHRWLLKRLSLPNIEAGLLVSHLDGGLKSGGSLARQYCQENGIIACACGRGDLATRLRAGSVKAVVFVDDLIGSGESVVRGLGSLEKEVPEVSQLEAGLFLIAVCGTTLGQKRIESSGPALEQRLHTYFGDILGPEEEVLSEASRFFTESGPRQQARELFGEFGKQLNRKAPFGFRDCGLAVAFDHTCPNNSLPVLWAGSADWRAMFPRHA